MQNDPRPDGGVQDSQAVAIEKYVVSYLTDSELQRSWQVIEELALEASRSQLASEQSRRPHFIFSHLDNWRLWIPVVGTVAVTLALCSFALRSTKSFTLHAQGSDYRSSTLPPTLDVDLKHHTARLSGAGMPFAGPIISQGKGPLGNTLVFSAVLSTTDGAGQFDGKLYLTNSEPVTAQQFKFKIIGASLDGVLAVRGVGTNSASSSFAP